MWVALEPRLLDPCRVITARRDIRQKRGFFSSCSFVLEVFLDDIMVIISVVFVLLNHLKVGVVWNQARVLGLKLIFWLVSQDSTQAGTAERDRGSFTLFRPFSEEGGLLFWDIWNVFDSIHLTLCHVQKLRILGLLKPTGGLFLCKFQSVLNWAGVDALENDLWTLLRNWLRLLETEVFVFLV
jgi:hypothetical protein